MSRQPNVSGRAGTDTVPAEPLDDNLDLAQAVMEAAQREMARKARLRLPALRFGAVASVLGACATAASYRASVQLLERKLPPELAALVAAAAYGGGATGAAILAANRWRGHPVPLPTETARQVVEVITDQSSD
ncbi:phage holin family protein [Actinomadura gamaensis]|uniref:Phage holin family protein n=1 Tax=Actinomadura gamaensis TaxID=1763541 RepID=A0ABV9U8A7_9ACTN